MALTALLFAHHGAGSDGEPPAMRSVAGLGVIERQVRQARRCGAGRVIVVVERMPPRLAMTLAALNVEIVRAIAGISVGDERVLVIEDALVVDARIVLATLAKEGRAVAVWKGRNGPEGAQRIDPVTHWAGVAVYPGALVSKVLADLGEWDLQETLLRAAFAGEKPVRVDIATIDDYEVERKRKVPLVWAGVRSDADAASAGENVLAAGQQGCPDWPARYVNTIVENWLVRALLDTRLTPGAVHAASAAVGAAATLAFATGWLWVGLALALLTAPLQGGAHKLALAREHGLQNRVTDKLIEYSWYLGLAGHFALSRESFGPIMFAAMILLASIGGTVQREMFTRFTGRSLDDCGGLERRFRLVASGRDTNLWLMLPFAALEAWYAGFVALALYAVGSYAVAQARFYVRLDEYARAHSPRMAANLDARDGFTFPILRRWLSPK